MKTFGNILITALLLAGSFLFGSQALAAEYYISAEGDSLSELAQRADLPLELLAAANDLEAEAKLEAGRLLTLPIEPLRAITVTAGDTLWSLAAAYGISVEELQEYNAVDARRLYAGMILYAPLAEEQAAVEGGTQTVSPALIVLASRGGSYIWPAQGPVSSRFGPRGNGFHYGLDIAADSDSPIIASLAGTVIEAGWKNDAYGYTVMLDHGDNTQTLYAHASRLLVQAGQTVKAGQSVALIGSTGNSTGAHLHFEVRINNICRDPLEFLDRKVY